MIDWEREWRERILEERRIRGKIDEIDYWDKRAEDYTDYIRTSNYEHGRKILELFKREGILKPEFVVLDIGAGPGSVSIPFAEVVRKVVAVEPSKEMVKNLIRNAHERGIENIEVINRKWEDVNDKELEKKFDLVIASHISWLFPDIGKQIVRMNRVSRGYCCIVESVGYSGLEEMYKKLGINPRGFDRFIYLFNILYHRGILANVRFVDTIMRRSIKSATSMWELFLSRYREPTDEDREIIRRHVLDNSVDGIYQRRSKMAVIWWRT